MIESTDVRTAVQEAMAEFNRRYFTDQSEYFGAKRVSEKLPDPDHIYFVPWGDKLQQDKTLPVGEIAILQEISHARLFRLVLGDGQQFILRADPSTVVKRSVAALSNGHPVYPPVPTPVEIRAAYLKEIAGHRAEVMLMPIDNVPAYLKPFQGMFEALSAYAISIEIKGKRQEIIVAWVRVNERRVYAIASGKAYPTRAVLVHNRAGDKLALAPVSYVPPP